MVQNQPVLGFESGICRILIFLPILAFPRVVFQSRDGPPAAVGGSDIIGSRHDSLRAEGDDGGAALAQHHMGSRQQHHSRGSSSSLRPGRHGVGTALARVDAQPHGSWPRSPGSRHARSIAAMGEVAPGAPAARLLAQQSGAAPSLDVSQQGLKGFRCHR